MNFIASRFGVAFSVALVAAVVLSGCDDRGINPQEPVESESEAWNPIRILSGGHNYDGVLQVGAHSVLDAAHAQYLAGGTVAQHPDTNTPKNGGTMTAGGVSISPDGNNVYSSSSVGTFGANATFGLTGNTGLSIPSFSTSIYSPSIIKMSAPDQDTLRKSTGATVNWSVDPNTDSVFVFAKYEIARSTRRDSTLSTSMVQWYKKVPDGGSYSLTLNDMSVFPVGGYVTVGVARGNASDYTTSGARFLLISYSTASYTYLVTN